MPSCISPLLACYRLVGGLYPLLGIPHLAARLVQVWSYVKFEYKLN